MREIGEIKVTVAIGQYGGGVILNTITACEQIKSDLKEYGSCIDDFFHAGTDIPKEHGVYLFDGKGYYSTDENGYVDETNYVGEFIKLTP